MLPAIYDFWLAGLRTEMTSHPGWAHAAPSSTCSNTSPSAPPAPGCWRSSSRCILGPRVIRRLISLKVGQPIRTAEEVHKLAELHGGKIGTPTMGGVLILGTVLVATLVCARPLNPFVAVCACTMAACGLLGLCDDYKKVKERKSDGISSRTKLGWQLVIALIAAVFPVFQAGDFGLRRGPARIAAGEAGFTLGEDNPIGIGAICFPLVQGSARSISASWSFRFSR